MRKKLKSMPFILNFTYIFLIITFIVGVFCVATLPWWTKTYMIYKRNFPEAYFAKILHIMYPSGIGIIIIFALAILLMKNVRKNKPFIRQNVNFLKVISIICIILAFILLFGVFYLDSIFIIFMCIVFFTLSMIIAVIGKLFSQAIAFKEENDLTI